MSTVSSAVVLVLIVEQLLVSGPLGLQGPLAVEGEVVLVIAGAAQPTVVQGQTVDRVLSRELEQEEQLLDPNSFNGFMSLREAADRVLLPVGSGQTDVSLPAGWTFLTAAD